MSKKTKAAILAGLLLVIVVLTVRYFGTHNVAILSPQGPIGEKERHLILLATGLSMIVVIPVYFMLAFFAWNYRASNKKAKYDPHFDHSRLIESIWWGVPLIIIFILGIATWQSSKDLDPFKPLASSVKPINIQVVALQWKWLFIYPEQSVAAVNFLQFPVNTPVNFAITSDAPMNSFWIPQLGGQIYAMSGMSTHLHLMAKKPGDYNGSSANISGSGFSDMHFMARASSQANFDKWLQVIDQFGNRLDMAEYTDLAKPAFDTTDKYYSYVAPGLYAQIVDKFMDPLHKPVIEAPPTHRTETY